MREWNCATAEILMNAWMYTDGDGVCPGQTHWDPPVGETSCQYSQMTVMADFHKASPSRRSGTHRGICLKGVVIISGSAQPFLRR